MNADVVIMAFALFAWFVVAFIAGRTYEIFTHEDDVLDWAKALTEQHAVLDALLQRLEEYEKRYGKL